MASSQKFGDYRDSHQGRGRDYDDTFEEIPYRKMIWQFEQRFIESALKTQLKNRPINHLDFACGTGRIVSFLEKLTEKSTGVDIASSMLDVARTKVKKAKLLLADIFSGSCLVGEKFNLITAFRFFPNAEDILRKRVMCKLSEFMDEDGILIFNNHRNQDSFTFRLLRLIGIAQSKPGMTNCEVECLLQQANLRIKKTFHVGVFPIIETRMIFPVALIRVFELIASRIPLLRRFALNVVYVCEKDGKEIND